MKFPVNVPRRAEVLAGYLQIVVNAIAASWQVDHAPDGTHRFRDTQTTVGTAGAATALPATPSGYLNATLADGTAIVIPYYAAE